MSHLHYLYRHQRAEATLPDIFFANHPVTILVGLGGSALGIVLAAAPPPLWEAQVLAVLNTLWFAGWTIAGLHRLYKSTIGKPKPKVIVPLSDDEMDAWKDN